MVQLVGSHIHAGKLTAVYTNTPHAVGSRAYDDEGNEYIFLMGLATMINGGWVTYDEVGTTTLLAANAKGPVAVAMATPLATQQGWFCIFGKVQAFLAANCADNALIGVEVASGYVGDARVAGDEIYGAISRGASTASAKATVQIWYPFVDDANGS